MKLQSTKIIWLILVSILAIPFQAFADARSAFIRIEGSRIRSAPRRSGSSEVLGLLYTGAHVQVLGTHGRWTKIKYLTAGNRWVEGYVNSNLLTSTPIPPRKLPPAVAVSPKLTPQSVDEPTAPKGDLLKTNPEQQTPTPVKPAPQPVAKITPTSAAPESPVAVKAVPTKPVVVVPKPEVAATKPAVVANKPVMNKPVTRKPAAVCATKFEKNSPAIYALEKMAGTGIDGSKWKAEDSVGFKFSSSGNLVVTVTSLSFDAIEKIAAAAKPPVSKAKAALAVAFGYIYFNAKICALPNGTFSVSLSGVPGSSTEGQTGNLAVRPAGGGKIYVSGNIAGSQFNEPFAHR